VARYVKHSAADPFRAHARSDADLERREVSLLPQENHEHQQAMERDAAEHHREQASRVRVMMAPDDDAIKRDFPANRRLMTFRYHSPRSSAHTVPV
jgi:hypothetical protein